MLAAMLVLAGLTAADLAPGVEFDPAIPTLQEVVGHELGAEITDPRDITRYLQALAEAAPDRTRLVEYARTWEGRPLSVLIVGAPERIARLDEIGAEIRRLADPRGLDADEAERLVAQLPVGVWLMHAVHGNEISSSDAALAEAWYLLAARGDARAERILSEALVMIDPLENPDGRARFVTHNLADRAAHHDAEPAATEHDEPWPRGRSNHYLFDMNRDWLALTQPETRGRVAFFQRYFPQVVVDLHEMGGDATYYFAPPAPPDNPHITDAQRTWWEVMGRANAERFDARGFGYFVREVFDSFYPGYGESWPLFHGAVGMTYEQASARGLRYRREDDTILTYAQSVLQHFVAAIETAHTAAQHRQELLRDFVEHRRSAIAEGQGVHYLLDASADPARSARLGRLLVEHGIEVRRLTEDLTRAGTTHAAGTLVVAAGQPAGRLVRTILEPHVPMDDAFVDEQARRVAKRQDDEIYDVTGFSLPLLFDVSVTQLERLGEAKTEPFVPGASEPQTLPAARVGYLVPWGSGAAALTAEALRDGLRASVAGEWFSLGGRRYPAGTVLFRTPGNPDDLAARLATLAVRHGGEVVPTDTGWVDEGISLGSFEYRHLEAPRVVLAWDDPTYSLSAGWARYVLEQRYAQHVSTVRVRSLRYLDWERVDVLVLPAGDYEDAITGGTLEGLRAWVRGGGTLVTLGEASRWAAREESELLATRTELRDGSPEVKPDEDEGGGRAKRRGGDDDKPFDLETAIQPERERPESTPGALLRVELDTEHWLAFGTDGEVQAVVEGRRIFTPITLDEGTNVGLYAEKSGLVAGGLAWDAAQASLARKAFLIHQPLGRGHIVAFAEDPNYRAFAEGTELLFMNAVLLSSAY